jgi:hypothetical protein
MREIDRVLIVQKSIKDFFWRIKSILKKVKNQCCVKISQFSNFQHWRSNSKGDFVLRNQFKCRYERFGMMNLINKNLRSEIFYKNDTNLKPYIIINCFHLAKTGSKGKVNKFVFKEPNSKIHINRLHRTKLKDQCKFCVQFVSEKMINT